MWVRGLKHQTLTKNPYRRKSHPMWVRGLKHIYRGILISLRVSHPMWVRGLKRRRHLWCHLHRQVAPHVGAWIETSLAPQPLDPWRSHPMWVRGLKHHTEPLRPPRQRRTPCGCVD